MTKRLVAYLLRIYCSIVFLHPTFISSNIIFTSEVRTTVMFILFMV
jgi:hypothetical protein